MAAMISHDEGINQNKNRGIKNQVVAMVMLDVIELTLDLAERN